MHEEDDLLCETCGGRIGHYTHHDIILQRLWDTVTAHGLATWERKSLFSHSWKYGVYYGRMSLDGKRVLVACKGCYTWGIFAFQLDSLVF